MICHFLCNLFVRGCLLPSFSLAHSWRLCHYGDVFIVEGEYLKCPLPKAVENCIFHHTTLRNKTESLLVYTARKAQLFKDMEKAEAPLPDKLKGYLLLRDARLSNEAWRQFSTW